MASFCSNCGSPAGGRFCPACGAATGGNSVAQGSVPSAGSLPPTLTTPGSVPPPVNAPIPAAGSSSATKIILIVVAVVVLLGATGVAGLVYVGYRAKQRIAELKQEYGVTSETASSSSSSSTASARVFPPSKGSGCPMLDGQAAAGILGVGVDRVEFTKDGPDGSEWCRYWVGLAERQRLERAEIVSGINAVGKADEKNAAAGVEKLIGGVLGAAIDAQGDNNNDDFAFSLQLWRNGGRSMWDKMDSAKSDAKALTGVDVAALTTQQLEGIGDRAMILPAGHSIMVLKGDTFFLLGFQQFVPGREKTAALARAVAGRM